MAMPVKNAKITNAYKDPLSTAKYSKGYHTGIDLVSDDKNIYATLDSTVLLIGWDPNGWGKNVILRTSDEKHDIIHAHLSSVKVQQGEKVNAGQIIGIMGTTGNSTGVHLHYEVRKAPWIAKNDINAADYLGIKNKRGEVISMATSEDKDIYLSVRVRTSKADALIKQIIEMGYACKKLDLA